MPEPQVPSNQTYRCVCGESFAVEPQQAANCPKCQRHYSPAALEIGLADTLTLPVGESLSDSSGPESAGRTEISLGEPADPLLGTHLGHFLIDSKLGRGGMGSVYQALDESLQRYVALKVIRTDRPVGGNSQFHRLLQEARAQARVNHPNVVQIFFVGLDEAAPYFAMELVRGNTLAQLLAKGPLPFAEVVKIALQLINALECAAQFDIVHGDIKPGNILVQPNGSVKIADFGLARSLSDEEAHGISGSPCYLSPEAAQGGKLDQRSDMYSLGITLFELTFGKLPYPNATSSITDQLRAHLEHQPVFPEHWPTKIPEGWRHVLAQLLEKDPSRRPSDYSQLRAKIKSVQPVAAAAGAFLPRTMAWMFDSLLTLLVQAILSIPIIVFVKFSSYGSQINESHLLLIVVALCQAATAALGLLSMAWIQANWLSPGKKLFQLKIVDAFGLVPKRRVSMLRCFAQFPYNSALIFLDFFDRIQVESFDGILWGIASIYLVINALMVPFSRSHRALHDRLLRTRVVVAS